MKFRWERFQTGEFKSSPFTLQSRLVIHEEAGYKKPTLLKLLSEIRELLFQVRDFFLEDRDLTFQARDLLPHG